MIHFGQTIDPVRPYPTSGIASNNSQEFIKEAALRRYETRQIVETAIKAVCVDPNQGMITLIAEKVYDDMTKKEFEK